MKEEVEDPIVMYIVVREILNLPAGKMCAQVGHAVQYILSAYYENQLCLEAGEANGVSGLDTTLFEEWQENGVRKVVLKGDDKEWEKLKEEFGDRIAIVRDAGLTCDLKPGTETVIAFFPMRKSQRSKSIKRLQVQG